MPPNPRHTHLRPAENIWTPGWASNTASRGFNKSPSVGVFQPPSSSRQKSRTRNLCYHYFTPPTSARISLKTLASLRRNNLVSLGSKSRYYYYSVIQVIYYTSHQIIREFTPYETIPTCIRTSRYTSALLFIRSNRSLLP